MGVALGAIVGWALSEISAHNGFTRQVTERQQQDRRSICLNLLTAAETSAHEGRDVVAMSQLRLVRADAVTPEQLVDAIEAVNNARLSIRLDVQRLRIIGPPELHHAAETLMEQSDQVFADLRPLAGATPRPVTTDVMDSVDDAVADFRAHAEGFAEVAAAVLTTSTRGGVRVQLARMAFGRRKNHGA